MRAHKVLAALLLGLLWFALPHAARAQSCGVTDTAMNFGAYNAMTNANHDANGVVQVYCIIQKVPVVISLDQGLTGTYAARRMTTTGGFMTYNLYTNAGRTTVWGNGTGGTQTVSCTTGTDSANGCDGSTQFVFTVVTYPVYGRIPTPQNVVAGNYTDSVTVTITF
jgi:spore coat protein U-like protein